MTSEATRTGRSFPPRQEVERAVSKLGRLGSLSEQERALVLGLLGPTELAPTGTEIVREAPETGRAGLIVSGWASRQRLLPDGRRQIFDLLLPGDFIGVAPSGPLGEAWTVCLTRVELADAEALRRSLSDPAAELGAIRAAFGAVARQEQLRILDHLMRLGRQTAFERVGHLFLELHDRLRAFGLAEGGNFPLPLTQEVLADVLGLSVVHVNRVLQQLKRENLIELHGGRARIVDPHLLAQICDFNLPA